MEAGRDSQDLYRFKEGKNMTDDFEHEYDSVKQNNQDDLKDNFELDSIINTGTL